MSEENKDIMKEKLGCGCCTDDSIFLKAISNARADRIKVLERDIQALKEQSQIDLRVKKDLDKRLDDLTADRNALYVQHLRLKSDYATLLHKNDILNNAKASLMEANRGLQSKVAKQANEIKRLNDIVESARNWLKVAEEGARQHQKLKGDYATLSKALDQASKDAKDNFMQGYNRGMDELWAAIRYLQDKSPSAGADICGYRDMRDCVSNLSAQDFAKKVTEWEEKEAHDIKIGDEVIRISPFGSDDSECFIVYSIEEKANGAIVYRSIGSGNSFSFSKEAIADGSVRKTGRRYDSIPFDYID